MSRLLIAASVCLLGFAGCGVSGSASSQQDDVDWLERIEVNISGGAFDAAIAEGTVYVQEYPRSFEGWSLLGWAYLKTDQTLKASECFDESLSINPEWDNGYVGKGAMYRKLGDNAQARAAYLKAIDLVPENAEAFTSLLVIELLEGNDMKAVEYGEKAWVLRKDLPTVPANLAIAYHYLGDHVKRDEFFRHAKSLGYHRLDTIQEMIDGEVSLR